MRTSKMLWVGAIAAVSMLACGGGSSSGPGANAPGPGATTKSTDNASSGGAADADAGAKLYAQNCASCHGDKGEGTGGAPAVVGKGALPLDPPKGAKSRTMQFKTAKDVLDYIKKAMPDDNPGSLKDGEYLNILAFDLKANGVDLGGKPLDASSAANVTLPH